VTVDGAGLGRAIWERVFRFRLMPPLPRLHQLVLERDVLGTTLWTEVMRPGLVDEVPALFAADAPARMRRIAMDLRRVGASAYVVAASFYYLHGDRPAAARTVGVTAMWFAQAAAVLDYILDEEGPSRTVVDAHLSPEALAAALPPPGSDHPPAPLVAFHPELGFVMRALDHAFAGLRACLAGPGDDEYRGWLHGELMTCMQRMTTAELASPSVDLAALRNLDDVERGLDLVNTQLTRMYALAGLALAPPLSTGALRSVLRAASLAGDIGWSLDALSDVVDDLDRRVWSRAWLWLARERQALGAPAWRALVGDRPAALTALHASGVIDRMLGTIDEAVAELGALPDVAPAGRAQLVDIVQLLVWSFLSPPARAAAAP
jgi:hypothetical protein